MEFIVLLLSGLFLGATHAFEPDHLAAISTFSTKNSNSKMSGILWGLGHTVSLLIATSLVLFLKLSFPVQFFELLVGIVLVTLGVRLFLKKGIGNSTHQFAIGLLHGLAGTASLIVIMASLTATPLQSILFVLIFGIGSIVGMYGVSFSLSSLLKKYSQTFTKKFTYVVAFASVGIGLYKIAYYLL